MDKCAGAGGSRVLTGGDIGLRRFIAVVTKTNLHTRVGTFAQSGHEPGAERIAEPHIVNRKVENLICGTDKRGQPRHHGVGGLLAFGEKKNRNGIH